MPINFACPSCAKKMRASDDKAGRKTKCPKCASIVVIPKPIQGILERPAETVAPPVAPSMPVGETAQSGQRTAFDDPLFESRLPELTSQVQEITHVTAAEPPVMRPIPPANSTGKQPPYDPTTGTWEALVIPENVPEYKVGRESAGMTGDDSANSSISFQKSDAGGHRTSLLIGLAAGAAVLMLLWVAITLWAIGFFAQSRTQTQDAPRVVNVDGKGVEQRPEAALPPAVGKNASSPAAQGIGAQAAHLVEATIRPPLLTEKQKAAASDAIKALGKIEAGAQVGVNFQQYGQLVIDAKAVVNETARILPPSELLRNLQEAIDAYKDAGTVWNHKIRFSGDGLTKEYGHGELIERYALPLNEQKVANPELALQVMWAVGADRLTIARALLEGKTLRRTRLPAQSASANSRAEREGGDASPRTETPNAPEVAAPNRTTAKGKQQPANSPAVAPATPKAQSTDFFVGRWRIVDDKGKTSTYFTLTRSLQAKKSHTPSVTANWQIVGTEARITWSDGWKDILRPQGSGVAKLAFGPGASWDDAPANTQRAIKEP